MLDLVQVSRELVLLAQRLAAERATDDELHALREHHERRLVALRAGDPPGVERGAMAFHTTILRASRNQELQRVYPMVFPRLERVFRVAYPEWFQDAGVEVDGRILAALEARDPRAVAEVSGAGWDALEAGIRARAAADTGKSRDMPAAGRGDGPQTAHPTP